MNTLFKRLKGNLDPIPMPLTPLGMAWARDYPFEIQTKLFVEEKLYNPEFKEWLWQHGQLLIADVELFLNPPNWSMPIHCDGGVSSDVCKINFAFCDAPSLMKWYRPLTPGTKGSLPYDNGKKVNVTDVFWFEDQVEQIAEEEISIHLVNVGHPHSVTTTTEERRCLSVNLDAILEDGTEVEEVPFEMGVKCLFNT